jgi:hypothetical protein
MVTKSYLRQRSRVLSFRILERLGKLVHLWQGELHRFFPLMMVGLANSILAHYTV